MTNEQLTAYLQDESYLYSVSYEELKTLVMQYPYSANLRILLLKKSYLDKNKDYDRNLQMSATYTTNRKYLYKTIKRLKSFKFASQNVILGEEYLELTELSNIERLLAERHVTEAVQSATKLDSLAQDWKLEIDDIIFNEDTKKELLDAPNLPQNIENSSKNILKDEDEIDSLINSLVSEYNHPPLDLRQESVQNEENYTLSLEENSDIQETEHLNFEGLVDETSSVTNPHDVSDLPPSVSEDSLFNFIDEDSIDEKEIIIEKNNIDEKEIIIEENNIDEKEIIIEENNIDEKKIIIEEYSINKDRIDEVMSENENIEPSLTPKEETTNTELSPKIIEKESEEHVKKTDIQLEIINQTKASIVEKNETKPISDKKPSFTEWLSQFRMTPPQSANHATHIAENLVQTSDNQTHTSSSAEESLRRISRQNMVEIFETESDVPDDLYGLADKNVQHHFIEDDDDDDDEVFSEYESNPQKKKKSRPMHQLAIKSLVQDDELVSETLADLLAWQGNKAKAIEMYRKLILQFPEKSSYFATKIEKISI